MDLVLVFTGDCANVRDNYSGATVYECSMVVPLKEVSKELEKKIKVFNDTHEESISQQELVKYCIDNSLVLSKNFEHMLEDFYNIA